MLQKFLICSLAVIASISSFSQGLEGIIVERYYLSDANDEADANNNGAVVPLPAGSVTFRVYVDMAANYKFSQIFGNAAHNLTVNSTANFYNDPSYGVIINPGTISATNIRKHTAMIDSWFTTGGVSNGKVGVLKSEDTDGSIGNQHNVLQNNPGGCYGLPINGSGAQDGLTPNSATTYLVPNALGLGNALDALDQTAGNSIVIGNGAIAALGGIVGPTSSNRVLIAQFTTSGVLSFSLNVQLVNVLTGGVENYVANDPAASELTHPTLSYNSNTAPTIQLTSPTSGAMIGLGNYMLTANASDNLGSVASVEFFVDGVSVGVDNASPYEVPYNATPGSHQVYAVARDYDCLTAQTSNIPFSVSNNQAPVVSLSGPTSAVEGSSITFTAAASDADGTITSVQFYVDGVSIGSDNSSPYSATWTAVLGANQQVTAIATDNTGLSTTSNVIVISVAANVPPTINITYPFSTTDVTAPELVPLTAEASDSDGLITQVSFYVNGLLVGTVSSAPYIYNWLSQAGPAEITAVATDSNGAQTTSNSVNIVVLDPSTQPYAVGSVTQACNLTTYCIPIQVSAAFPVNGVIGYDITMTYNSNHLQPTGNAALTSQLINSNFASVNVVSTVPGQVQVQITLNGNAPGGTSFNGYGTLGCIEFNRLPGFGPEDSSFVNISSLIESYVTGPIPVAANAAYVYSVANTVLNGTVYYGGSAAALVSGDFGTVSQTDVFGITAGQISNPLNPAVIDNEGGFSHELTSGTEISFNRDIPNEVSVQSFINGGDVLVAKSLLNNSTPLTIWQMLALDVNMDGFITAGDISQMNQRATLMIGEYQQAWNYDNQGNSNGQPSKDWLFIGANQLSSPAYQISSTFPNDDQIGFSALRVPVVPFTLPTLATDFNPAGATCQSWADEVFHAVLLGDADGNYMSTEENASDSVVFDISQAIYSSVAGSNFIEIPVKSDFINGDVKSLDIATKFNLNKLVFVDATSSNPDLEVVSYFNSADAFIRIVATTNSNAPFSLSTEILKMKFEVISDCAAVTSQDFNSTQNWLNGSIGSFSFLDGSTLPEPIQVLAPAPYCSGSPIEMTYGDQIEGLDIVSYAWSFGDGSTATGQTVSPSITAVGDVSIVLSLTVGNGCVYEVPGSLFLNTSPQASFTYSIDAGQTVTFNNTSIIAAGSIASNAWDFGDGQNAADASPIHTYAAGGSYTVTLTIASALGCESSYSQSINTVGVNELEQINLSVYPNPAVDQITVTFNQPIQLDILDVNGRVVYTNTGILWSSPSTVWVGDLSSGLYVIRAIQGSSMVTRNIVIE